MWTPAFAGVTRSRRSDSKKNMKRYGNLWDRIISWENLVLAARKAQRGKRDRDSVQRFNFRQESELLTLQRELQNHTYRPGLFRTHWLYRPKKRLISAAPYRDRVVHHALMNILEPILDTHFHPDSYACRKGKGTHAAADRLEILMRRCRYALQCDIRKFFPSIDHELLKTAFRRLIKDKHTLWLMDLIVDNSNEQPRELWWFEGDDLFTPLERRRGLPIGNLTSQWFANWMLNGLDHYITSHLGIGAYVRYCDDFVLLHSDSKALKDALAGVRQFLSARRLRLHERKVFVRPVRSGITFVGYRIRPTHRLLRKENIRAFRRRVRWMKKAYADGRLDWEAVKLRLDSWMGHAGHTDSKLVIKRLSQEWTFTRGRAGNVSRYSRRCVEQQCKQLPRREPEQQQSDESQQQHRISCPPALSDELKSSALNRAVYGSCERGIESPGSVPELRAAGEGHRSRIYVVGPGGSGRSRVEGPIRPLLFNQSEQAA